MADSTQTGGYGLSTFTPQQPSTLLAGIKPLTFSGGGEGPIKFTPLAGWSVPSAHPEAIGQGIASAIQTGIQAISAAYVSKSQQDKQDAKEKAAIAREDAQLEKKHQWDLELANIRKGKGSGAGGGNYVDVPSSDGSTASVDESSGRGTIAGINENNELTDGNGNVIPEDRIGDYDDPNGLIPVRDGRDSDPNGLIPRDDVKAAQARAAKVLPADSSKKMQTILQAMQMPVVSRLDKAAGRPDPVKTAMGIPDPATSTSELQMRQLSEMSTPTPGTSDRYKRDAVPAGKIEINSKPLSENSSIRNPIEDIKNAYSYVSDKAKKFGRMEDISRREANAAWRAGESAPNGITATFKNLQATFAPQEQQSFGDRMGRLDYSNQPLGSAMATIPAGTQPAFIAAPPDAESERIGQLMRDATQRPIAEIAPYVSASNQPGPAGMANMPVPQATPDALFDPVGAAISGMTPPTPQQDNVLRPGTPSVPLPKQPGKPQLYSLGRTLEPEETQQLQARGMQQRPVPGVFQSLAAAQAEADKHYPGYEPKGNVKWSRMDKGYIVDRPPIKSWRAAQLHKADMAGLAYQNEQFNKIQDVVKIGSQHRLLNGFISAYETAKAHPETQNISDLDLIDSYVAFARGAGSITGGGVQVTESQYNEIKNTKSVPNQIKNTIEKWFSGAKLTQEERDTMLKTMVESYNKQAHLANNKIATLRESLKYTNHQVPETLMPHPYPILRDETAINGDMRLLQEHSTKLKSEIAKTEQGSEERAALMDQYTHLMQEARKLGMEKGQLKQNQGIPTNLHVLDQQSLEGAPGWMQGLFPKGSISGGDYEGESSSGNP